MSHILENEGIDASSLFERAGLSREMLSDPSLMITGLQELDFQRGFVAITGTRPDLWIETGQRYRWLLYGLGGIAASTAPNLHELARSMPIWADMTYSMNVAVPISNEAGDLFVGIEFDVIEVPESLRLFTIFRDMGAAATFFRDVLALEVPLLHFEFSFSDPQIHNLAERLNAASITYDAPRSGYVWGNDAAQRPLPNSEPLLHQAYLQQCREINERIAGSGSFLERVVHALQKEPQTATIDALALELGASKRTLQRRLREHGMTFHELRGTVLARRSRSMLLETQLPIADIAWTMGYADPTAFTHAFRRWTGLSPRSYRSHGP